MYNLQPYNPPTYAAIERADLRPTTKKQYIGALILMKRANVNPFDFDALALYADGLKCSARGFLKAALAIMLGDLLTRAQAGANVANLDKIQVLWHRVQAMNQAIQTHQPDATRTPHWLTQAQVDTILTAAYRDSLRDYIVLALLFSAGLRRDELVNLTYENFSQLEGKTIITLRGKGDKKRSVPITDNLARHIADWKRVVSVHAILRTTSGRLARAIDRHGNMQDSLSASGIYDIVRKYGQMIDIADLDPHDCRRTYGRLCYLDSGDIVQVMIWLGHADTKTTLRYIGMNIQTDAVQIVNVE